MSCLSGRIDMSWGDNGKARPTTKEYRDKYDEIFKKKEEKKEKKKKDKK